MTLRKKGALAGGLAGIFLLSLFLAPAGAAKGDEAEIDIPAGSKKCVGCHGLMNPGIVEHWKGSKHARMGVGCVDCHVAEKGDADGFEHHGAFIATIVTPGDCSQCHAEEGEEFGRSHHAAAGHIMASLDNYLAEVAEGARAPFNPHSPTPGRPDITMANGMASAVNGCHQCHGGKVALKAKGGGRITVDDLKPGEDGRPTNQEAVARVAKDDDGRPILHPGTWPNTGIGRINLDGSRGSCSACHSRHDFSRRRARRPENCGKCHLGPDHPQKEIYEESKHGIAYRDLEDRMNLDSETWILGKDYSAAPTCATCHMSGHSKNQGKITHDPGERISWTNRPPVSLAMDTDKYGKPVKEKDPAKRKSLIVDTAMAKRDRMVKVCRHCHTPRFIRSFYKQYDDLVVLFNEKFAKPGAALMAAMKEEGLISKPPFDDEVEWTWFYLWHHEGRRARMGASMMAPDYTHWHGMYEVADRFYVEMVEEVREVIAEAREHGKAAGADRVEALLEEILARPEHQWFEAEKK